MNPGTRRDESGTRKNRVTSHCRWKTLIGQPTRVHGEFSPALILRRISVRVYSHASREESGINNYDGPLRNPELLE